MAYNELIAERIRRSLTDKEVSFDEKKMMGGLCFLVDDKMVCGIHFDKKRNTDLLMARIGEQAQEEAFNQPGCEPMDFTGKPMMGYVFVRPEGFSNDKDLNTWLQMTLDFNPFAKSSKKKK